MRDHAKRIRAYQEQKYPEPDPKDLESNLKPILNTEGILDLWIESWDKVMAGEHRNAKLLYLIATTRLFNKCMSAAIKGPSSGGKSEIRKQVLEFFPPEDIISFTSMSEKALLYEERNFPHKILSMGEAAAIQEKEFQDMLLRELMSEGILRHRTAQKVGNQIITQEIVKNGPVCFLVTTTKAALHPENETRIISLEVDDSEAQTRRVLKKQAQTFGRNIKPDESIYHDWQDFQPLLRVVGNKKGGWKVDVPFAEALADLIPPRATRLRRDYPQIIAAIKAHCLIHCYLRDENERGELIADLNLDYIPVASLIGHIASEGAGIAVSKEDMETIHALKIITSDPNMPKDDGAQAFEVGKKLNLDKATAGRRLSRLLNRGFAINLEQKPARPGKWRLTDQEIEAESLLPSAEEIEAWMALASERSEKSAQSRNRSGFGEADQ
jgi:predicted transcriptional regulator